jgi:lipopolysaccharide/colanic/teichoic acid biosynthesis glycosyltransferase
MSLSSPVSSSSLPTTRDMLAANLSAAEAAIPINTAGVNDASALWSDPVQRTAKRLIDLTGAGLALLLLLPVLLLIAVIIRLTSRGPALFRQARLGRNGEPFQILKFRTMIVDAEQRLDELEHLNESEGGVLFKMKRDPRITGIGRVLRRTSLDELPQIWNVLRGEMSLVGPRPLQLRDSLLLAQIDPEAYSRRLDVLPGLTGLWQARGRSETGFEHMLRMDRDYIREWSIWLDLVIIVETALGVVRGKGAC